EISGAEQVVLQGRIEATGTAVALPASVVAAAGAAGTAGGAGASSSGTPQAQGAGGSTATSAGASTNTGFGSPAPASSLGFTPSASSGGGSATTGTATAPAPAPATSTGPLNAGVLQVTGTGTASAPFPADNTGGPATDATALAAHLHPAVGADPTAAALAAATGSGTPGLGGPRLGAQTPAPAPQPTPEAPLPRPDPRNALAGGATGTGGRVRIIGREVQLGDGLLIDVSGPAGGGTVLAGGELKGQRLGAFSADQPNAQTLWMAPSAQVRADATGLGHGGTVILWADDTARIHGTLSARGGPLGGNGGFIETSGKRFLDVTQAADASAPLGQAGTWLLDPYDIIITGADNNTSQSEGTITSTGSASTVSVSTIQNALNVGTNVSVVTGGGGSDPGNITVSSAITKSGGSAASLTLDAHGSIFVNNSITASEGLRLDLVLKHGTSGTAYLQGATIDLGAGTFTVTRSGSGDGSGSISVTSGTSSIAASSLSAGSLSISGGSLLLNNPASGSLSATLGALTLTGGALGGTGNLTITGAFDVTGS
ncbi:MAG: hypothetical protein WCI59_21655, partial [Betaproteobacteria bacterium]